MDTDALRARRLHATGLTGPRWDGPADVVAWLGAVQSQDYAPAIWSLGQRIGDVVDEGLHRAFDAGAILRTHVLRPTWHFVTPADIRWLLALTASRVHTTNASYYRRHELDESTRARGAEVVAAALAGGQHRTRAELKAALADACVATDSMRLGLLLLSAELDGVICSGPRRGKQHTYALLDERVPAAAALSPEEALATLTRRYFASHGPATAVDFRWWSSLTAADVTRGLALVGDDLVSREAGGLTYWWAADADGPPPLPSPTVHLLQSFDEYLVAYRDSQHLFDPSGQARASATERPVYNAAVLLDGRVVGRWKRTLRRDTVDVDVALLAPLDAGQTEALQAAAEAHAAFLDRSAALSTWVR